MSANAIEGINSREKWESTPTRLESVVPVPLRKIMTAIFEDRHCRHAERMRTSLLEIVEKLKSCVIFEQICSVTAVVSDPQIVWIQ